MNILLLIDEFSFLASEGFSADLTELSDHPTQQTNQNESDEDSADVITPLPPTPLKSRFG
jgi:hypothetical protein